MATSLHPSCKGPKLTPLLIIWDSLSPVGPKLAFTQADTSILWDSSQASQGRGEEVRQTGNPPGSQPHPHPLPFIWVRNISIVYYLSKISSSMADLLLLPHPPNQAQISAEPQGLPSLSG